MRRVLVLSPHPDDEAIGCGGTLRKHVLEGDVVRVVFLTFGEKGGHGRSPEETRHLREAEARRAAKLLGLQHVEFWGQPDGALRSTGPLVQRLRAKLAAWKPKVIYLPHPGEMHPDHRATVRLLRKAMHIAGRDGLAEIRLFEVWTPLQRLDVIVDVSPHMKTKLAAIRAYKCQCQVLAFDEAIQGLNRYRGEMHSWPGGDYAEVFMQLRL